MRCHVPNFFFIVAWTSISVRTPKPTLANSSVIRSVAASKGSDTNLPKTQWLIEFSRDTQKANDPNRTAKPPCCPTSGPS